MYVIAANAEQMMQSTIIAIVDKANRPVRIIAVPIQYFVDGLLSGTKLAITSAATFTAEFSFVS